MAGEHHCSFVSKMNWRRSGDSLHPSVHVLSVQQNSSAAASQLTLAWLLGTSGVHAGEDFRLTEGESVLGSGWDADIVLTSPDVSRTHAKITSTHHLCVLEDLGSSSGTFVNGERCDDPRALQHLDVLRLGMGEFIYFALDPIDESSAIRASIVENSELKAILTTGLLSSLGWLICQSGDLQGCDFRLMPGVNRVGSLPGLEVCIPDSNLNQVHFTIECASQRFYLRSTSSDVQILRNKLLIEPGVLRNCDEIRIGALTLKFRCIS